MSVRMCNLNKIIFNVGDPVILPLGEEGIIDSINEKILWGFRYNVKITKGGIFNQVGELVDYKAEQFELPI